MTEVTERVKEAQRGRFRPYGEYRDSGVEWLARLPSHWEVKPVKAALVRNDSGVWGEDFDEDGTIVLRSTEQTMQGTWRIEEPARRRLSARDADYARLREGDLLVTKSSGSAHHIGKTSIVDASVAALNCCYSNFMQRLRVSAEHFPRFVWYFMNCPVAHEQLVFLSSTTTGLGNLNGSTLGAIRIPMAPPDEQRAIVDFLDRETAKVDTLVARKERLIELLQEKRTALITRAVTRGLAPNVAMKDSGVEWLGEIPAHWEVVPLKHVVHYVEGPGIMAADFLTEGVPLLRISGIGGRWATLDGCNYLSPEVVCRRWSHFQVRSGDLLISGSASTGFCTEVDEKTAGAVPYTGIIIVRPRAKSGPKNFVRWMLLSDVFATQVELARTGSTIQHFGPSHLARMRVVAPPLHEQVAIAALLDRETARLDALVSMVRVAMDRLKEFRTSLISAAVTGKIDVREAVPR